MRIGTMIGIGLACAICLVGTLIFTPDRLVQIFFLGAGAGFFLTLALLRKLDY